MDQSDQAHNNWLIQIEAEDWRETGYGIALPKHVSSIKLVLSYHRFALLFQMAHQVHKEEVGSRWQLFANKMHCTTHSGMLNKDIVMSWLFTSS